MKIESNTQTNQTLEQMAQAIFKSWFVDFDPVKAKMNGEQPEGMDAVTASLFPEKLVESELGLIPEGWEVGDLSDLMDFNPKRTLKKGTIAPYLDMKNMPTSGHLALDIYDREMGSGTKFKNGDSLLARITPCLENGKTAYVDFLEDEQVGWGSTEYIVMRSKSDSYKYFSYYMARFEPFRKFAIQSMTGTSGRQRAQAQTVQTMPFAIPPISILEKFDEFVAPNMQMIKSHGSENRTLAALRDTLLPKLLSGEIDLAETTI
ncbi:restriction endonuclease subunit S [Shewanella sp. JNE10-2]|uniref:restriction endonuclease subunit S n=1 Tax=Shewanella sp. JNE10-2 TaxID=2989725 RepID=UPI002006C4F0|nr:restriction endonuclease subunit S [Shewanella sp. JNE10-2]UPO26268.1 restriction endonuclease subunit S [Shewanella sp. JNE10-2]